MAIQEFFFYGSLIILLAVFSVQIFRRALVFKIVRPLFFILLLATFSYLFYLSYLQYQAFQSGPLQFTLGTLDGINWFIGYVRLHFWNQYLISLLAALLIVLIAEYINKRRGGIHFEREEFYLSALGIFLVGYPGWIFYLAVILILSALVSFLFIRRGERLPLYHFWIPTAIAVLLVIQFWAKDQAWWGSFRF